MTFTHKHPVFLIHGMWSTGETLKELEMAFQEAGYETHAPSLPHHVSLGHMTEERKTALANTGIQQYVSFLLTQVQTLKQPPIIIGHSMGGLLAQLLTQEMAKRGLPVHRVILLSSAGPAGINGWYWSVVRTFGHNLFKLGLWQRCTNLRKSSVAYGIANTLDDATHTEIYNKRTLESGLASWQIGMWFLYKNAPTFVDENLVTCPMLILGGDEDRITPIQVQHALSNKYTQAQLNAIEGACHWTVAGKHLTQVCSHMFNWLDDQAASTAA